MASRSKINVGVFGASGYTGFETVSLLRRHPSINLVFATSERSAGGSLSDIYPVPWNVRLIAAEDAPLQQVDAVFCCLPHGASMPAVIAAREAGVRVIDLSADFRLTDPDLYQKWYGVAHESPSLLEEAVYGLPELFRPRIAETDLLANPGCYPTTVLLALAPLLQADRLDVSAPIIADCKSGVSGAGRKLSLKTHFVEANENLSPYSIGRSHRHVAEMAQVIDGLGGAGESLIFSPHLVPINRGMLSTIYVSLAEEMTGAAVHSLYEEMYSREPLMHLLPPGQLATMAHTRNTNLGVLSITSVSPRHLILCSSIDNLGKGAAGQAIQNFNIMFGIAETEGML